MRLESFIKILALACATVLSCRADYPERPIHVVVHVPPGGGTDNMARLVLKYAGHRLGQSFIVENYKGAGGQVGYTVLARAAADGYTIGTITTTSIVTHELTRKRVSYSLQDSFIPLARVVMDPSGIFVRADSRFQNVEQLIDAAREKPGWINCAGTSLWGSHHVHLERLKKESGLSFNYVPFDGASDCRNALLGGHIELASGGIGEFSGLIDSGLIRPLIIAAQVRMERFPDVPVYRELGIDLVHGSQRGFAMPTGTPQDLVEKISKAIEETMFNPDFIAEAKKAQLEPVLNFLGPDDFRYSLVALQDQLRQLVK